MRATLETKKTLKIELQQEDVLEALQSYINSKRHPSAQAGVEFVWENITWNLLGYDVLELGDGPCLTITLVETRHDET
jgi:hypothetical protein